MREASEDEVWLAAAAPTAWPLALTTDRSWRPVSQLAHPGVRDEVAQRLSDRLGGCPQRVAWSTLLIGLSARLWGALLPALVREGVLLDPAALAFRDDRGALQLGLTTPKGWYGATPADVHERVVAVLRPVVEGTALSSRLLWGNVASALAAAPRVLELPEAAPLVQQLLELPPYKGEMVGETRATCCLFYLVPGAGLCGDCVLTHVPSGPARPA